MYIQIYHQNCGEFSFLVLVYANLKQNISMVSKNVWILGLKNLVIYYDYVSKTLLFIVRSSSNILQKGLFFV